MALNQARENEREIYAIYRVGLRSTSHSQVGYIWISGGTYSHFAVLREFLGNLKQNQSINFIYHC